MNIETLDAQHRQVLVAFTDRTEISWLRILKPGFRHCLAIVQCGGCWVVCEGLSRHLALNALDSDGLSVFLEDLCRKGYRIVRTIGMEEHGPSVAVATPGIRIAPFTCVEVVKRILRVDRHGVLTPYQLWKAVKEQSRYIIDSRRVG